MVALGNGQFTLSTVTISHCKLSVGSLQQIVRGQAIFLQHWLFHVPIRGQAGSRAWQGDMCLLIFVTLEQCLVLGWYCKHFSIDVFWILGQICIYIYINISGTSTSTIPGVKWWITEPHLIDIPRIGLNQLLASLQAQISGLTLNAQLFCLDLSRASYVSNLKQSKLASANKKCRMFRCKVWFVASTTPLAIIRGISSHVHFCSIKKTCWFSWLISVSSTVISASIMLLKPSPLP